jgi:hypothetical protein
MLSIGRVCSDIESIQNIPVQILLELEYQYRAKSKIPDTSRWIRPFAKSTNPCHLDRSKAEYHESSKGEIPAACQRRTSHYRRAYSGIPGRLTGRPYFARDDIGGRFIRSLSMSTTSVPHRRTSGSATPLGAAPITA